MGLEAVALEEVVPEEAVLATESDLRALVAADLEWERVWAQPAAA
jgi:hypothetical protein